MAVKKSPGIRKYAQASTVRAEAERAARRESGKCITMPETDTQGYSDAGPTTRL